MNQSQGIDFWRGDPIDAKKLAKKLRKKCFKDSKYRFVVFNSGKEHRLWKPVKGDQRSLEGSDLFSARVYDDPNILKHKLGGSCEEFNKVCTFEVSLCNQRCWYCFQKNEKLCKTSNTEFLSPEEILDKFISLREEEENLNSLRISGGEPGIYPDLWIKLLNLAEKRGLKDEIGIWSETNCTTGISEDEESLLEKWSDGSLDQLGEYDNFYLHPCIHGITPQNLYDNTRVDPSIFGDILKTLSLLIDNDIDIYPTIAGNLSPPEALEDFFDRINKIHEKLPLKFYLIKNSFEYEPTKKKIKDLKENFGQPPIYDFEENTKRWDRILRERKGYNYGEIPRYKIRLE